MEYMFRAAFERLVGFISFLIFTGLVVGWSIDMQRRAAAHKKEGLISLSKINKQVKLSK